MKKLKLLFMGFGNAGKAYAKLLLAKQQQIAEQFDYECVVTGITTGTRGNLVDETGISLKEVLEYLDINMTFCTQWKSFSTMTNSQIVDTLDYDVLVEMTPLNIHNGQPAIDHIKGALRRGKHVITANKGPIAWEYKNLLEISKQNKVHFLYETTVMDGTPVFNLFEETLPLCTVTEVSGILNTTTNYVLFEMEAGRSYEEAIKEGKRRGFVEADPSMDIEGYDAAAKITVLLNVLMNTDIKPTDIDRNGIENVTMDMIRKAAERNHVLKLVCRGWRHNDEVKGEVKLKEIPRDDLLASVKGTTSIVSISTDLMGQISVVEHEPEIEQTGYGIFSDTLRLIKLINKS